MIKLSSLNLLFTESAGTAKGASAASITPLLNELVTAINTAHSSVTASELGLKKRQVAELAPIVAGVVSVRIWPN